MGDFNFRRKLMSANLIEIDISKIANMHVLFMYKNNVNWNFQAFLQFLTF